MLKKKESFIFRTRMGEKKKKEDKANGKRIEKKRIMGFDHGTDRDGCVYR